MGPKISLLHITRYTDFDKLVLISCLTIVPVIAVARSWDVVLRHSVMVRIQN